MLLVMLLILLTISGTLGQTSALRPMSRDEIVPERPRAFEGCEMVGGGSANGSAPA